MERAAISSENAKLRVDVTTRLREIVEAATPGEWRSSSAYADNGAWYRSIEAATEVVGEHGPSQEDAALIVASTRLARAVADPAFVEKVARTICRPIWRTAFPLIREGALDQYVEMNWREYIDAAEASISLLAAHALGEAG